MKKHILLILTFLFVFKIGQGQTNVYHPFPDSNAVWNETSWYYNNGLPPPIYNPNIVFLAGDTVISTIHYKKLLSSGYRYATVTSNSCCVYYNAYAGAIRQDTIHKKVYYRNYSSTSVDTLLYDFNLNVGDTLPKSYINNYLIVSNFVSSIDSILIGTSYRKQYHISVRGGGNSNYVSLIEGIGSTFGLTYPLYPPLENGYNLNCFSQNNVTLYPNSSGSCSLALGIKEQKESAFTFSIYPNPSSGNISITGNINIDELKVSDMLGQLVYEAKP
ncbi:MAG TPA: hypothetical protein VF411_04905, partial [Bacteroidia bacterium]